MKAHGCHNRAPLRSQVVVQNGWITVGNARTPVMVRLPDPMSKDCQHTRHAPHDPQCAGCRWQGATA